MPKVPYEKPARDADYLVQQLISRGLVVKDQERAERYLKNIGYYRLSGYFRTLADPADPAHERFIPGSTFQQALDIYIFDRKLRVMLGDALERIEVAVKAVISDSSSLAHGPFWLYEPTNFNYGQHGQIINEINESTMSRSAQHLFVSTFGNKYSNPYPPSWMVMETLSFGAVSRFYELMKGALRLPVAHTFALQHDILESWLHSLSFTRNVCAHHSRLWNRVFTIRPKIPNQYRGAWPQESQALFYVQCCVVHHMMKVIAPQSSWVTRFRNEILNRPKDISLKSMGFPEDWEQRPFWGFVL